MIQSSPIVQQEQRFKFKVKALLESAGYRDGISNLTWDLKAGSIDGVFADRDGSKIFSFSIGEDGVNYRPVDRLGFGYRSVSTRLKTRVRSDSRKRQCDGPTSYPCGASCISDKKQCRIRDTRTKQAASALLREARQIKLSSPVVAKISSAQLDRIVESEESKIRSQPIEFMAAIDPSSGAVLFRKSGTETSIDFTPQEMTRMKGAIVTHNHPNVHRVPDTDPRYRGYSFSESDIQAACYLNMKEVRAVSQVYKHSMTPPKQGWSAAYYESRVKPSYQRNARGVYSELINDVWRGRISGATANVEFHHRTWERVAKETGMGYRRWS